MMKRTAMLLATVGSLALAAPALADSISLTATCDGVACGSASSPNGTLDVNNQAFGIFNLNTLSINSATFLVPPGVLSTNTLDVDQNTGGNHTLVLDIVASGLTGVGALENFLSSFSVSGQTAGWSIQESTFINGTLLAAAPTFTAVSDSFHSINSAFESNPFIASVVYTITSSGTGSVNGGIDISTSAVPEPSTWAMLLLGFVGLGWMFRSRRKVSDQLAI